MKWDEIEELHAEQFTLYGVLETHPRDMEDPPYTPEYSWVGCNRKGTKRGRPSGKIGKEPRKGVG